MVQGSFSIIGKAAFLIYVGAFCSPTINRGVVSGL